MSDNVISASLLCLGLFLFLYIFTDFLIAWSDSLYAQPFQQQQLPASLDVRITSPTQGQQVSLGAITIFGVSSDDASTNCEVFVDRNDQAPFQRVVASGPGGIADFSDWTFSYNLPYASITEGNTNELTAKLSCPNNPVNLTAFHTVNVTGIASNLTSSTTEQPIGPFTALSPVSPIPFGQEFPPAPFNNFAPQTDSQDQDDDENSNSSDDDDDNDNGDDDNGDGGGDETDGNEGEGGTFAPAGGDDGGGEDQQIPPAGGGDGGDEIEEAGSD